MIRERGRGIGSVIQGCLSLIEKGAIALRLIRPYLATQI